MFFSAKEYSGAIARQQSLGQWVAAFCGKQYMDADGRLRLDTRELTQKEIRETLRAVKQQIIERKHMLHDKNGESTGLHISKWIRPWEALPALAAYTAPEGDYGVGVEVEMGFVSREAAQRVAEHIANWKYVCLDFEGGEHPIEATFPPSRYSTFNGRSQVARYLDFLQANEALCEGHRDGRSSVGTHVNVSKGGVREYDIYRCNAVTEYLGRIGGNDCYKYFGRRPYGYIYRQAGYLEFKLFKSVLDSKVLLRYVDIAVALTALITSGTLITDSTVREALELGYNKRNKAAAAPATAVASLPLAA